MCRATATSRPLPALRAVGEPIFGADASQISMANLLAYLFEVTERFGMATRTELILLQRTMVVVEGVARSLDPQINIWQVARPVVERYIRDNLGPKAALRDLGRAAQVLGRFAPLLPEFLERRMPELLRESPPAPAPTSRARGWRLASCWGLWRWRGSRWGLAGLTRPTGA